jgi:glycosyltransferase involved in cell wall biosynthesis
MLAARANQTCPDTVHLVGSVTGTDKRWLLQNCAFMAAPSLEESFGIVALEAMACGKPVIGTANTGLAEVIQHGITGEIVQANDRAALSTALARTLETAPSMGSAARRHAESFAWPAVTRQYLEVLRGCPPTG